MFFFFNNSPYIAIIGDVKKSRNINDRSAFQEKLKQTLIKVNQLYSDSIASNFTITLGDEFQGLLHSGKYIMDIIHYIKKEVYPNKIRFGIGIGNITTEINFEMSIGADGPGYYKARESVENLKLLEKKKESAFGDIVISIDGDNFLQELSLNSIFKLMYSIENSWTKKQREVINYVLFNKMNQTKTAEYFNVTQSNIQQILSKGHFYAYKDAFDTVNKILSEIEYDK
ncbi:SatD family protein [uncultured Thomasclavelia sp.]|uniref:SatD family protein n=1 Tax=uncultured Thomasclavelia sp. TaxID=3025759 RepID=UPI0025DE772D|nr:SatD family protein [uncultured Thomasclavelia sp.]